MMGVKSAFLGLGLGKGRNGALREELSPSGREKIVPYLHQK